MAGKQNPFVWYELLTSDVAAAKAFYASVVGWNSQDMPMPGMTYTLRADAHLAARIGIRHLAHDEIPALLLDKVAFVAQPLDPSQTGGLRQRGQVGELFAGQVVVALQGVEQTPVKIVQHHRIALSSLE